MKKFIIWYFLLLLTIFILTSPGSIHESDGLSMFELTKSIVEKGTFAIDNGTSAIGLNGQKYSPYGIGQSVLAIPFYLIGYFFSTTLNISKSFTTKFMVSMFNPLIQALTCIVIFLISQKIFKSKKISLFLSLIYGFATMSWVYSKTFFSEPLASLALLAGFYLLINDDINKISYWQFMMSGIFTGIASLTRIASVIEISVFILFIILISYRKIRLKKAILNFIFFLSPIFLSLVLFLVYNFVRFGSPFITGYSGDMVSFKGNLLLNAYGQLFSTGRGLFLFNPILIASLIGIPYAFKKNKNLSFFLLLSAAINIIGYSKFTNWHGGWGWGPRYLLMTIPFFVLFLGYLFQIRSHILKIILTILLCISIPIQLSSITVNYQRYYYKLAIKYGDSDFLNQLNYSPIDSPLIGQFKETYFALNRNQKDLVKMGQNQLKQENIKFSSTREAEKSLISNNIFYSGLHLWVLYLYYFSYTKLLVILLSFMIITFIITLYFSIKHFKFNKLAKKDEFKFKIHLYFL